MKSIYKIIRNLIRSIKAELFIHGYGSLPKQYAELKEPMARVVFCQKHFGKDFMRVIYEREYVTKDKVRTAFGLESIYLDGKHDNH